MSGETLKVKSVFLSLLTHSNIYIAIADDGNNGG